MQAVITEQQARQITGGRKPLVPVEYESAVKELAACSSLDEAKYWDNKADALAAWARIYHSDEAGSEAKKLKLHAYRRMGQLAIELRPKSAPVREASGRITSKTPGSLKLLKEHGLKEHQASSATKLGRLPPQKFDQLLARSRVPTPGGYLRELRPDGLSEAWSMFSGRNYGATQFRTYCRGHSARSIASGLTKDEASRARAIVVELQEWLDEFEQYLPK